MDKKSPKYAALQGAVECMASSVDCEPADLYEVIYGDSNSMSFDEENIEYDTSESDSRPPLPRGARRIGVYPGTNRFGKLADFDVVAFMYHKTDPNTGELETKERVIIVRGYGCGDHPGHTGQPSAFYLVGPQIGTYDWYDNKIKFGKMPDDGVLESKNFSVRCMNGNSIGKAILANSH